MKKHRQTIVHSMIVHGKMVYFIVSVLVIFGIIGLVKMEKDEFPTFEIKQGLVAGVYPGASADEVEMQLTKPLEEIVFSFKEVNRKATYSYTKDGICYLYVDLNCSSKKKAEVWSKIKLKLNSAKKTLPHGVLAVEVLDDFSTTSALLIAMESEDKGYREMQEYADELCTRLKRIPELASVKVLGKQSEEIAVTVDMERATAYGISPAALMLDYQTSSLAVPSGNYETDAINSIVDVESIVNAEEEVSQKIIYSDPLGSVVRLKDIASVERKYSLPDTYVNFNGNTALVLSVEMRPDNNIVSFGSEVDKVINEYMYELPDSVNITKITDQPEVVDRSVMNFLRDLLISMLVVILVMLLLFPFRSAIIASSGIPVIIAITIGIMCLAGIPLHMVTLAALITVLGMIVDDSVITMDGYMDKLDRGMKPIDAASASVKELFMPMFIATLAISMMFFPVLFIITGYLGDFVGTFPWIILISLMISLVYAVCVVPILMTKYIQTNIREKDGWFRKVQNKFFGFIQRIYEKALRFCFKHTKITIITGVVAIILGIFMFTKLNIQMMPMAARDCFAIEVTLDANAPIEQTKNVVNSLETLLLDDTRVLSVTSFIGESAPRFMATYSPKTPAANYAQIIVNTDCEKSTEQVLSEYEQRIYVISNNANIRLKQIDYQAVNSQVEIKLKGADRDVLYPIADSIKSYMLSMNNMLQWVHSDNDYDRTVVQIDLDSDEAVRLGVNKSMLAMTLSGRFNGSTIATLYEDGYSIPVKLYSKETEDGMTYMDIGNQIIPTATPGVSVPLRQIADITPHWRKEKLVREAGEETVIIAADLKFGKSHADAMVCISNYIDKEIRPHLPENVLIEYGGLSSTNGTVGPEIALSFLAAVTVLFIFLLIHFKKLSLAVMTMAISLMCLFGSSFGLWILDIDFGITSVLGLISVVGIIIRNGIILFDYAEELRFENGYSVDDAAYEAGCRRMRPIFLTSITTALGVLPMIISGGPLWKPMGLVIAMGTVLTIALIVLIMPVSYKIVFRNESKIIENEA